MNFYKKPDFKLAPRGKPAPALSPWREAPLCPQSRAARLLQRLTVLALVVFILPSCAFLRSAPSLELDWPLKTYKLTQKFVSTGKPPHLGIDLKAPVGANVFSGHSGRVVYAGNKLTGYGNVVVLEHSFRWASLYAHLQKIKVKTGQTVRRGDIIGAVGKTGRVSGPHLHFELIYKKKPVNPLLYLP